MVRSRHILVPLLLAGAALPVACGSKGLPPEAEGILPAEFAAWVPERDAFAPARLRVHPLTRITRDGKGAPVFVCHIVLRDALGQVARCLGVAQVELVGADAQGKPVGAALRVWQVDLRDPLENAAAFDDVVTRTYALHLGAPPEEAAKFADAVGSTDGPALAVRARFVYKDAEGVARQLEAVAPLREP